MGDGDVGEQEGGDERPARDEEGREPRQEADRRVKQEEEWSSSTVSVSWSYCSI